MCARVLLGASCFPLLSTPARTSEAFSFASWRVIAIPFLEKEKGMTDVKMHGSDPLSVALAVGSTVSNILQLSRHPRSSPPRADPYCSGVPSSECLAFSPQLGATLKGIVAPDHSVGMAAHPDCFYPILLLPSLFHRC